MPEEHASSNGSRQWRCSIRRFACPCCGSRLALHGANGAVRVEVEAVAVCRRTR